MLQFMLCRIYDQTAISPSSFSSSPFNSSEQANGVAQRNSYVCSLYAVVKLLGHVPNGLQELDWQIHKRYQILQGGS